MVFKGPLARVNYSKNGNRVWKIGTHILPSPKNNHMKRSQTVFGTKTLVEK